jgi:hypothetical protein
LAWFVFVDDRVLLRAATSATRKMTPAQLQLAGMRLESGRRFFHRSPLLRAAMSMIRTRLSVMMFFEFVIWGAWYPLVFGYLPAFGFDSNEQFWILQLQHRRDRGDVFSMQLPTATSPPKGFWRSASSSASP